MEDAAAADAGVEDGDAAGLFVSVEAAGEDVGPAGVGVLRAVGSVGDAVPEGDDGGGVRWGADVHGFDEVPGVAGLGGGEVGGSDLVAGDDVVGLVREVVEGEGGEGLGGEEDGDGEVRQGREIEGGGVRDGRGPGGDGDGGKAAEGEGVGGGQGDIAGFLRERDMDCAEGERFGAELIGELDADERAAGGRRGRFRGGWCRRRSEAALIGLA